MNMDTVIREWGNTLGLKDLALNDGGVLAMELEGTGRLGMQRQEEMLLVYLAKEVHRPDRAFYRRALMLCNTSQYWPRPVQAALADPATLLLLVRYRDDELTIPELEEGLRLLRSLHAKAVKP